MKPAPQLDKIDLQLIRTLFTLITERSVSRTALRLGQQQPAVSLALRRLRELTGDPILVRSGTGMVPTDAALQMIEPAQLLMQTADQLFAQRRPFEPAQATQTFRIAASDTLDPWFLPGLVARVQQAAPQARLEIHALSPQAQYAQDLAQGRLDLVVGNWTEPPAHLHRAPLFEDPVACLVSAQHPAVRRGWSVAQWLECAHVAPTPAYPGWRGIIDEQLDRMGLARRIAVRCAHFGLMPRMVASSLLVLTTGRQYCQRSVAAAPGLVMLDCPVTLPPMTYYQLWHDRTHAWSAAHWLREQVRESARQLPQPKVPS
ncbi:MAG: HTH-type transcriptional regulator LeuO [Pseudomonadota bacterium]|jgi:DNA-binding transcriptional LysR family regulator